MGRNEDEQGIKPLHCLNLVKSQGMNRHQLFQNVPEETGITSSDRTFVSVAEEKQKRGLTKRSSPRAFIEYLGENSVGRQQTHITVLDCTVISP